jgi:hypothetical protein
MNISIEDISPETVSDIPKPCKTCLYWEIPERFTQRKTQSATDDTRSKTEKASWFVKTLKEFGNCGKILYVDGTPVGYAQYSTPDRFPNITEYHS